MAHACVNFAILNLELKGFVPTTKKQIVSAFLNLGRDKIMGALKQLLSHIEKIMR